MSAITSEVGEFLRRRSTARNQRPGSIMFRAVKLQKVVPRLTPLIKAVIGVATRVSKKHHFNSMFLVDVVEEVIRPLVRFSLNESEVTLFFDALSTAMSSARLADVDNIHVRLDRKSSGGIHPSSAKHNPVDVWKVFLAAFRPISIRLYERLERSIPESMFKWPRSKDADKELST